jgi:uncharacterized coiled-coil DUF342 family protein
MDLVEEIEELKKENEKLREEIDHLTYWASEAYDALKKIL